MRCTANVAVTAGAAYHLQLHEGSATYGEQTAACQCSFYTTCDLTYTLNQHVIQVM